VTIVLVRGWPTYVEINSIARPPSGRAVEIVSTIPPAAQL
jgi:hypothetical protein